jgi:lipopolysaccharide transport system ATP-binding protein
LWPGLAIGGLEKRVKVLLMSSEVAIKVEGLSKCYHIYDKPRDRLMQMLMRGRKQYFREFWALNDVSFEIKKGDTVGVIGRNGSGKSTLLQMICGTLNPTNGEVYVNGRIAALLELGSGFNPEFTGLENVYMSCSILGLTKEETLERLDDIVAFADIGDFFDQPVKTYSSGMFVRLAFSVNIMSRPEIMVVDEALSVGDMAFQAKCMTALRRIQDSGATVLFVSHDTGSVKSLCSKCIYLDSGQVKSIGPASSVAEEFVRAMREEMNAQSQLDIPSLEVFDDASKEPLLSHSGIGFKVSDSFDRRVDQFRYGTGGAKITFVELLDMDDNSLVTIDFDQQVKIRIHFIVQIESIISPIYYILDEKKNLILGSSPRQAGYPLFTCSNDGQYIVTYTTALPLHEGNYSIQVQLNKPVIPDETAEFIDVIDDAVVFNVQRRENGRLWSKVQLPNTFEIIQV